MTISTHILDAAAGRPARAVYVELHHRDGAEWHPVALAATDVDGRPADVYRLTFATGGYSPEAASARSIPRCR